MDFEISITYNPNYQDTAKELMKLAKQNNMSRSNLVRIIAAYFMDYPENLNYIVLKIKFKYVKIRFL